MLSRAGFAGHLRGFRADRPIPAAPPTGGGAFTRATVSTPRNIGVTLGGNQYETHRAVDPANPLKQSVCGKWLASEKDAFILWTTDGWATQRSMTWAAGDPVVAYAVNGDLLVTFIPKSGNTNLSTRINPAGAGTFGAAIPMGIYRDRPRIEVCRVPGAYFGRVFVCGTAGGSSTLPYTSCFWSDDHGKTWTRSVALQGTVNSGVYPDGQDASAASTTVLNDGTLVLCYSGVKTTPSTAPNYGYPYSAFAQRSLNGGQSFSAPILIDDTGGAPVAAKGGQSFSNVVTDGTRLYFFFTRRNENPVRGWLRTSDDGGFTWSARRVVITPPTGYGCNQVAVACTDKVLVVQYHVIAGQWPFGSNPYRVFTMWSFDRGATFSAPIELTTAPVPWTFATSTTPGAGQQRDAGEDHTGIQLIGNTAYLVWAQGTVGNLYYAHISDITFY